MILFKNQMIFIALEMNKAWNSCSRCK